MLKGGGNPDPNSRFKPKPGGFNSGNADSDPMLYCGENGLDNVFDQPKSLFFGRTFKTNTFG